MKASTAAIVVIILLVIGYLGYTYYMNGTINFNFSLSNYYVPKTMEINLSQNYSFVDSESGNNRFYMFLNLPVNDQFQTGSTYISYDKNVTPLFFNKYNRSYYKFEIGNGVNYINATYNFTTYGFSWHSLLNVNSTLNMIPFGLVKKYVHPEYFNYTSGFTTQSYEVINPNFFKNLTENITKNYTTVVGKLRAIYDYIEENYKYNITYNFGNVPLTAQQVYYTGEGDCEELSYLFESMARSIGIPAWTQYGILINENGNVVSIAEHAWVETYIPLNYTSGVNVTIDTTVEVGKPASQLMNLGFLVKYPNELILWTDDGNSTHMSNFHIFLEYPSFGVSIENIQENNYLSKFVSSGQIIIGGNQILVIAHGNNTIYIGEQKKNP